MRSLFRTNICFGANTVMQLGAKPVLADSVSLANLNVSFETSKDIRTNKVSLLCICGLSHGFVW